MFDYGQTSENRLYYSLIHIASLHDGRFSVLQLNMETGRILEGASLRPPESPRVQLFTNFIVRVGMGPAPTVVGK
jgi:hypothetical protein